jgi:hypothetical protein
MGYAYQWADDYSGLLKWAYAGALEEVTFDDTDVITDGLVSGEFIEHISEGMSRTYVANRPKISFTPVLPSLVHAHIVAYDDGGDPFDYFIYVEIEDNLYPPIVQGATNKGGVAVSFFVPANKLASVRFRVVTTAAQEIGSMVCTVMVTPVA